MSNDQKELDEFVYIVSHELNAPLRHIKQFGSLLVKRLEDKVSDEELEYLEYIEQSITDAEAMLSALLQYSRLNTVSEEPSSIDFEKLINTVLSGYDKSTFEIEIGNLPDSLSAKPQKIETLFACLIDNSIKFSPDGEKAKIKISAEERDGAWFFTVEDNGIGIQPKQLENVLKIFIRGDVKPQDHVAGVGAGLAISKKIVEQHGGTITVESDGEKGTRVLFSLRNQ